MIDMRVNRSRHAAATVNDATRSSATMTPSRMRMMRSHLAPTSASCVTSTTV